MTDETEIEEGDELQPDMDESVAEEQTLARYMMDRKCLSLADSLKLTARIADTVVRLHDRGKVFGVISPESVVMAPDETVSVFPAESADRDTSVPVCSAPELTGDFRADTRCDVYSLGVLFRFLITGQLDGEPGRMPADLASYYYSITNPVPEARLQTAALVVRGAEQLLEDAEALQTEWKQLNIPVQQRLGQRLRAFAGRQWAALCLGTVLVVVFGALGWQRWQAWKQQEKQRRRIREARLDADTAFEAKQFRDAAVYIEHYLRVLPATEKPARMKSMRRLVDCYRSLKNQQNELRALLMYLAEFPESQVSEEYSSRTVELTMESISRFGGVTQIGDDRAMVIDGKPDDWKGIEPVRIDAQKDGTMRKAQSDIVAFYCVVTGKSLVLRFDTREPPEDLTTAFCIGIDVNPRTFTDSAEDWDYDIGFAPTSPAWIWDLRNGKNYKNSKSTRLHGAFFAAKEVFEASLPLASINTPKVFSIQGKTYSMRRHRDDDFLPRKVIVEWGRDGAGEGGSVTGEKFRYKRRLQKKPAVPASGEKSEVPSKGKDARSSKENSSDSGK